MTIGMPVSVAPARLIRTPLCVKVPPDVKAVTGPQIVRLPMTTPVVVPSGLVTVPVGNPIVIVFPVFGSRIVPLTRGPELELPEKLSICADWESRVARWTRDDTIANPANTIVNNAIVRWGDETQKSRYLPRLSTDMVGAYALSEAGSGSDAFALATVAAISILLRAASAWACAGWVLHDRLTARLFWLLPIQDILAFLIWIAGFFGNHIIWRGRKYVLHADGRFQRAD